MKNVSLDFDIQKLMPIRYDSGHPLFTPCGQVTTYGVNETLKKNAASLSKDRLFELLNTIEIMSAVVVNANNVYCTTLYFRNMYLPRRMR